MADNAIPDDRSYTEEHEWVLIAPGADLPDTPVKVGITSVAACGEVESTKTVSELYPPVSGTVTAVNTAAVADPSLVTSDPYGQGWLFEVRPTAAGPLLTAAEYAGRNEVCP
jgi:glycine cleavage system H protein